MIPARARTTPACLARLSLIPLLLCSAAPVFAQGVPIVQPGAPGGTSRVLSEDEAVALARNDFAPADAQFMRDMIVHHQQAMEMAALVGDRTNNPAIVALAGRIDASQEDEIAFMREWLEQRGQDAGMAAMAGMDHSAHDMSGHGMTDDAMSDHSGMAGMASPEQMAQLAAASGTAFDRLFLELMIEHHKGALTMVDDLLDLPGTASDPILYDFTSDVTADQQSDIDRMNAVLASLFEDPRPTLAAGFLDAGEAISNLRHVAFLPKPAGFFDPANPADLRPRIDDEADAEAALAAAGMDNAGRDAAGEAMPLASTTAGDPRGDADEDEPEFASRGGLLDFANTDMAFSGDLLVAGNYHGFNIYRLGADDGVPALVSSVVCPGGQGDVSVVGDLLLMSVEQTRGRVDCGLQGVNRKVSDERFRGLRIFDISDITRPVQVGQVQTCRGSHTHSVVSETATSLIVYNSGTAGVRDEDELAGCIERPGTVRTALFRVDVIEIPKADPSRARIVSSPAVFADPETGDLAGLWKGGDHGDDTQRTSRTDHCHDITVFPTLNIAAGACSGNGILFDISDPLNPQRIDAVTDPGFAYWHSATFNNDGSVVLFTDEWGGGGRARCQASDPRTWGANAFYEIVDGKLEPRGSFKLPAPQGDTENCVAHNGSIIPVPGRNIFVQAWYQGGISLIDFTDPANVFEIGYFDRGPIDADQLVVGGYWSAYWYNGKIYATEITRGIDVFALEPSEFLSAEEIAAAEAASQGNTFNPQTQLPVTWSAEVLEAVERSRAGG